MYLVAVYNEVWHLSVSRSTLTFFFFFSLKK